jgi:hypothetical protein
MKRCPICRAIVKESDILNVYLEPDSRTSGVLEVDGATEVLSVDSDSE